MELRRLALLGGFCFYFPCSLLGQFPSTLSQKLLYTSTQSAQKALSQYVDALEDHPHDYALLKKIGENLLKQGFLSTNPQVRKSAILGAGLANSEEALDILTHAMNTEDPEQQLLVLSAATSHLSKTSDSLLFSALASPYVLIRLEAAYRLAALKNTKVIDHLHALIPLLPEDIQALSAAIFLHLETEESDTYIRKLLTSTKSAVRSYTAMLIGEYQQKRFLPSLRNLLTSAFPQDQEAALYALGTLKDGQSYTAIKRLLYRPDPEVSLAAAQALILLEKEEDALPIMKKHLKEERPQALYLARLMSSDAAVPLLLPIFLHTENKEAKLNAALALLKLGNAHPQLLEFITSWLIRPHYTEAWMLTFSKGRALQSWKHVGVVLPDDPKERTQVLTAIHHVEEQILSWIFALPKEAYLPCIQKLLTSKNTTLAAKALLFLSHTSHQETLDLLSLASSLPGELIIRAYADLALYNITKSPEKKLSLHRYANHLIQETLLFIDTETPYPQPKAPYLRYQITPEVRAKLLLDILDALVISKTSEDIALLSRLIVQGNEKNHPILAGFLLKIIE
ncbi:HEAT repeat domain-containing protein [Chlamydia pecorum]|uniref:Probable leader peptide Omp n=1 Tax=Chlamydia pecorum (strain ATCC VR-628 / DSM 29919 / E58) TaxID=331635 RepID=A0AA34RDC3_CHLPE|nr:HEAT repeat domain-containing protein [Chlamydia pecorum]AEB41612.1 probable leader peptide Omp [Chlamydia pecorum E58]UFP07151.1 HEAT repeat domain-containing protein [Chlamydia pecorum]UJT76980.1 putative leader peptide Omp [Chlamydia pecorum]